MKRVLLIFTVLFGAIIFISSCSKYDDNPAISLKTKNNRLAGEWDLIHYDYSYNRNGELSTAWFGGSSMNEEDEEGSEKYPYSLTITIDKDGTYEWFEMEDGEIYKATANWTWMDGNSSKEQLLFLDEGYVFDIIKLTKEELILEYNYTYQSSYDGEVTDATSTRKWIFQKQ